MSDRRAPVLRPLILAELDYWTPRSTSEIADRIRDRLIAAGHPHDIRGALIALPAVRKCRCGHVHDCAVADLWPVGTGLIKPQLDSMARTGLVAKFPGGAKACRWTLAVQHIPDTVAEALTL